jgi:hypothetical protein
MWSDIDYRLSKIKVTAKTEYKFNPKSFEIRSVDVPQSLLDSFEMRKKSSQALLEFPPLNILRAKQMAAGPTITCLRGAKRLRFVRV